MTVQTYDHPAPPNGFPDEGEIASVGRLAESLAKSSIVPGALRGKPADLFLILLTARDLGIAPTFGLSKIHVVDGKPTLAAEAMLALGLQHGHDLWVEETTSTKAVAKGRRRGTDRTQTVEITLDEIPDSLRSKAVWKNHPAAMLRARAISALCRFVIPDVLMGVSYTPDEAEEAAEQDRRASTPAAAPVALQQALAASVGEDLPVEAAVVDEPQTIDYFDRAANAETEDDLREVWADADAAGAVDDRLRSYIGERLTKLRAAAVGSRLIAQGEAANAEAASE